MKPHPSVAARIAGVVVALVLFLMLAPVWAEQVNVVQQDRALLSHRMVNAPAIRLLLLAASLILGLLTVAVKGSRPLICRWRGHRYVGRYPTRPTSICLRCAAPRVGAASARQRSGDGRR